ncbi:ATP-binding protein [Clostridium sp.]|uniref:ATP-binding protein n=1 Tax=Clostridium sp. TaxID=1506 RepID=UPI0034649648
MKHGLKYKFFTLFYFLIAIVIIIGATSLANILKIKSTTNTLVNDNYYSIDATNNMQKVLDNQNNSLINFINSGEEKYKKEFYSLNPEFLKYYTFQNNNITEEGEKEINLEVLKDYNTFIEKAVLIFDSSGKDKDSTLRIYTKEIQPQYMSLKNNLRIIGKLNEEGLLNKKEVLKETAEISTYTMISVSIILIIASLILSVRYINKFLHPILLLKEDIIKAKEGDFSHRAEIVSNDEVGLLAKEFNSMSEKICEFKNSTIGKIMEEKNKSEAIVKSIVDPLIVLDDNFRVVLLNDSCEREFNILLNEVQDRHILEAITNGELFDYISTSIKNDEEKVSKEIVVDDSIYNVNLSYFMDSDKRKSGIIVYFHNITKLKRIEKMKQDFIASLSHEVKTPLTSLLMGVSLLENREGFKENKNIISTISDDCQKIVNLINNFLRVHEIESSEDLLYKEDISLIELVETALESFYIIADARDIELITEYDEDIPFINGDREKLGWVLNNLLSNAIKYSNKGGYVRIKVKRNEEGVEIQVKDNGRGILEEDLPRIFDKFYRGVDDVEGTGLGLALSKDIISLHKGTISCNSIYEYGSIFKITLPLEEDENEE